MPDLPWRLEWDAQADEWVAFTDDDPFYDLISTPAFLELVPAPGTLTLDVGCGEGRVARASSPRAATAWSGSTARPRSPASPRARHR